MKYLITGDGGFIGTNLKRYLDQQCHEVIGLDRPADCCNDFIFEKGDDLSGTFTDDFDGITRTAWDMGAFFYNAGTPSTSILKRLGGGSGGWTVGGKLVIIGAD